MSIIILTIHILIAISLVFVILLQRSEGGGLGIGGGGGQGGGFMTARGTANLLTRVTAFLAVAFFSTSIILAILSGRTSVEPSLLDEITSEAETSTQSPAIPTVPADQ
jgi:preprotein translocase subunit SecG